MDILEAYKILRIEANAPIEVIEKAFRELTQLYHPDRYNGNSNIFVTILEAYKYLIEIKQPKSENKQKQLDPKEVILNLTMEEIFTGCEKEVIIVRNYLDINGVNIHQENAPIIVKVKQGILDGTSIKIENVGDKQPGKIQANVHFLVRQIEHPIFKRTEQFNLEYKAKITRNESLFGCKIIVPTLEADIEYIPLDIKGIVDEFSKEIIPNRGIISPDGKRSGDLIVRFDICPENVIRDPQIERDIYITLEQFLFGCIKEENLSPFAIVTDDKKRNKDKIFKLNIKPGTKIGHRFTFPQGGYKKFGSIPADVIFVVKEEPHPTFKRFETVHLEYVTLITSSERRIQIPTLENDLITMVLDDDIKNKNNYRIIKNRGLPYPNNASKRGNLIVRFKIEQNTPIISNVYLTPEEMLNGCVKKFELIYSKNDFNKNIESKKFKLNIPRGCNSGEEFIFPMKGNQMFRKMPSDVVFVVWKFDNSKQHYTRSNSDIEYQLKMTKYQAQNCTKLHVPGMDGEIVLDFGNVYHNEIYRIPNRGLPYFSIHKTVLHGDLIVHVKVLGEESEQFFEETLHETKTVLDLPLSLEEVLSGIKKVVKFKRRIISSATKNEGEMFERTKFTIDVLPGIERGTEFTYKREGHQNVYTPPGDVVFVASIRPHEIFTSEGSDLIYTHKLHPADLIFGLLRLANRFEIPTLDGYEIPIKLDRKYFPVLTIVRILKMGLPKQNKSNDDEISRGDLVVQLINDISDEEIQEAKERESLEILAMSLKFMTNAIGKQKQEEPQMIDVPLSFLEVLNGTNKEITIFRKKINIENGDICYKKKTFRIEIKPGTKSGTEFKFQHKGDHSEEGLLPADVIFTTTDEPHEVFKRDDNDLYYTAKISKYNKNLMVPILTLESTEPVWFHVQIPANEFTILRIARLGLPCLEDETVRGNIFVNFEINDSDDKDFFYDDSLPQDPPQEHKVYVSLLQVMNGFTLRAKLTRLSSTGQNEIKLVLIEIKPGIKSETKFIIPKGGDRLPEKNPSDVIFIVKDKPHEHFSRTDADLGYFVKLPTCKIGEKFNIKIPTLDDEEIDFTVDENVSKHDRSRTIEGLGLPHDDNPKKRGNLLVIFSFYDEEAEKVKKNSKGDCKIF